MELLTANPHRSVRFPIGGELFPIPIGFGLVPLPVEADELGYWDASHEK